MTQDEEKAKELNAVFASVFNIKTSCPLDTHLPEMEIGDGEISEACTVWEEMVSDLLCLLEGDCDEVGISLPYVARSERIRRNGLKLRHGRFRLDTRKRIFPC